MRSNRPEGEASSELDEIEREIAQLRLTVDAVEHAVTRIRRNNNANPHPYPIGSQVLIFNGTGPFGKRELRGTVIGYTARRVKVEVNGAVKLRALHNVKRAYP